MLSFELEKADLNNDPSEVTIFLDGEGLQSFIAQLQQLQTGRTDHVHLMSEAWGGNHLEG